MRLIDRLFLIVLSCLAVPALIAQAPATQQTDTTSPANAAGVGDLLVAPTRVVFEGRVRTAELALINTGSDTATYRISLMHMRMNPSGELTEVQTAAEGERFADDLIRFSPRQVVLEPHIAQTVRLQLRLPAELAAGEYRVNLLFRGIPAAEAAGAADGATTGFQIRLTPIYGVSIPLIVRHGDTAATVSLLDLKVDTRSGSPSLALTLNRSGNRSVYGNLTVRFAPNGGKEQVIGLLNGIAVYTPLPSRSATVPLRLPQGVVLAHGRLRATYRDGEQSSGNVLAEAVLDLP